VANSITLPKSQTWVNSFSALYFKLSAGMSRSGESAESGPTRLSKYRRGLWLQASASLGSGLRRRLERCTGATLDRSRATIGSRGLASRPGIPNVAPLPRFRWPGTGHVSTSHWL